MTEQQKCHECGEPLSLEVGIIASGTLAEGSPTTFYCQPCAPNQGKGYTIADCERMREESKAAMAEYEMSQMDMVGPDVYFAVAHKPKSPARRHLDMLQDMSDTLDDLLDEER